jgi:hypothetical protein
MLDRTPDRVRKRPVWYSERLLEVSAKSANQIRLRLGNNGSNFRHMKANHSAVSCILPRSLFEDEWVRDFFSRVPIDDTHDSRYSRRQ